MSDRIDMRVPAWCPLCSNLMKGRSTTTWYKWGTCSLCVILFIEGREEKWNSGWRPSQEEIELAYDSLRIDRE